MVNSVGFLISEEENLALGPETKLQSPRDSLQFYYSERGIEKASD